jgi:ACS family hexuronate transporter-like MFS transporter
METSSVKIPIGKYRWRIIALLFFATTINYIDRQVLGILKPYLQDDMGWSEIDYSNMVAAFQAAYALGYLFMGWLMDRVGTKKGFTIAITIWSIAAMAHAGARSVMGFIIARFALGLGEAGNFPACIKTVAEWFPKKERSFATGIFNAGTNIGAIAAPLLVPVIYLNMGWEWAFLLTGALGFIWIIFWLMIYKKPEDHPKVGKEELAYIKSDPIDNSAKIPWLTLLPKRQTLAFALGKFITDPVWWIYLFWLPDYLNKEHGLNITELALPLIIIYLISDAGSVLGGWLGTHFMKKGWSVNKARKVTMLICALCVVPILFVSFTSNLWVAVGLISLAAAAHQGWSANLFTLPSDLLPQKAVGSVVGIGGTSGAIGGMLIATVVGFTLELTNSYVPVFFIAGFAYLIALLVIHLLVPKMEPLTIDKVG